MGRMLLSSKLNLVKYFLTSSCTPGGDKVGTGGLPSPSITLHTESSPLDGSRLLVAASTEVNADLSLDKRDKNRQVAHSKFYAYSFLDYMTNFFRFL